MQTVQIGIVGAGNIAKHHLNALAVLPGIKVVGITSRTNEKAELLAREYAIEYVADTLEEMVERKKPDALALFVSADQMCEVARRALVYGKPVFLEKPPGLTPQETGVLVALAEQCSTPTMVGFNRRYYSIFHKGLEIIKQHGELFGVHVEGHERMWQKDEAHISNILYDNWIFANSTHTIDLLRFFVGDVRNMYAVAHQKFGQARGDQFGALMEFDSGAIGQYSAHWYSPGGWRVVLYGEGVTVEFKPLEKGTWMGKDFVVHEIQPDELDIKYKPGFYRQMEAFEKLVREGVQEWPALDLAGAYKTMMLAQQIAAPIQ